jgi:N-acetylglucosaminyl-diphospho-decaprenol L-rhamnosyltransferase
VYSRPTPPSTTGYTEGDFVPTNPAPDDQPPGLSVVIVNWNARDALLGCLRSLEAQRWTVTWEAVVVDNGSRDGSVEAVRAAFPAVRVIANADNRGLAAANNQGMRAARGEVLLICNPDVVFGDGAVEELLATLARHERAGFVVPRLLYEDGALATSAGDLPTLREALFGRQSQRRAASGAPSGFWWDGWGHDEERAIGRGHECAYVVRRRAVEDIGWQDEGYPLDWEGIEWTARLRRHGWEVWLSPRAEVVHLGGASIRQVPLRWVVSSHRGMYRYFAPQRPAWQRPGLAVAIGSRAAIKLAATAAGAAMYERAHRARPRPTPS